MKLRVFFNLAESVTHTYYMAFSYLLIFKRSGNGSIISLLPSCIQIPAGYALELSFFLWLMVVISFSHQSVLEHQQLLHNSLDQIDTDLMQGMEPSQIRRFHAGFEDL